jgi:hypothetical protein
VPPLITNCQSCCYRNTVPIGSCYDTLHTPYPHTHTHTQRRPRLLLDEEAIARFAAWLRHQPSHTLARVRMLRGLKSQAQLFASSTLRACLVAMHPQRPHLILHPGNHAPPGALPAFLPRRPHLSAFNFLAKQCALAPPLPCSAPPPPAECLNPCPFARR